MSNRLTRLALLVAFALPLAGCFLYTEQPAQPAPVVVLQPSPPSGSVVVQPNTP